MQAGKLKLLLSTTYDSWNQHNAPRLGAALAYYTLLSLAPLVILLVGICGLVLSNQNAEQQVLTQTNEFVGPGAQAAVAALIHNTHHKGTGIFATVIAFLTLFFGASGVFLELRNSLNSIWDAPPPAAGGIHSFVKERLASFAMVIGLGLFLLITLALSTTFGFAEHFAAKWLPIPAPAAETLNFLVSLVTLGLLFTLIYKFVPNVAIGWKDVVVGSVATAVLFTIGKLLLGLYLTTAAVGSAYGAAGSLIALVVWVYYSAQIFFFGAVFTQVYAKFRRSGLERTSSLPTNSAKAAAAKAP